jgi:hypothetical protein
MDNIKIEDIIAMFEAINSLGNELGHNITWGNYMEVREMLGENCIHTRQAARGAIENKQLFDKLKKLYEKMEPILDG